MDIRIIDLVFMLILSVILQVASAVLSNISSVLL